MQQLRSMPSVKSATMVGIGTVLSGGSAGVTLPGWPPDQRDTVRYNEIGTAYFATLRVPILFGREFGDSDTIQSEPVAVVNDTLARRLWPNGGAIGSTISINDAPRKVVGVVADATLNHRNEPSVPWAYSPYWQNPGEIDSRIAVRTAGDPAALLPALVREVHRIDRNVPIAETITLAVRVAGLTRPVRVAALFIGYAAGLAVTVDGDWHLQRARIRGIAADQRDRHSHCARRGASATRRRDRRRRPHRRGHRCRERRPAGDRCLTDCVASLVWNGGHRLDRVCRGRAGRCDRWYRCVDRPRAARCRD